MSLQCLNFSPNNHLSFQKDLSEEPEKEINLSSRSYSLAWDPFAATEKQTKGIILPCKLWENFDKPQNLSGPQVKPNVLELNFLLLQAALSRLELETKTLNYFSKISTVDGLTLELFVYRMQKQKWIELHRFDHKGKQEDRADHLQVAFIIALLQLATQKDHRNVMTVLFLPICQGSSG